VGECFGFRKSSPEIWVVFGWSLDPDCGRLIVVQLAWRLNEVHLGRRLIEITDWRGLIHVALRWRLIVDLRGLSNEILHGQ
jgi:hypothetical protein